MDWYCMVWRRYAEFDGRSRRSEFWWFALLNFCAMMLLALIGLMGVNASQDYGWILFAPFGVYCLASIVPSLAVNVRRFHDTGKSGWLLLLLIVVGVVPLVGFVASVVKLVFECTDSDPGTNQYGPSPKPSMMYGSYGGGGYGAAYSSAPAAWPPPPAAGEEQAGPGPTEF